MTVCSAFDLEREREWKQKENALKVQIAQLEATLRADVGEKGSILDKLNAERGAHNRGCRNNSCTCKSCNNLSMLHLAAEEYDNMEAELKEMRIKFYQTKQENDELKDKIRFFTKEGSVDFTVSTE